MHSFDQSPSTAQVRAASKVPRLDRGCELTLARAYASGDRGAGHRLVEAHLRDVIAIARGYRGYGLPLEDLVAEGNLGLVCALERFDPERELRFMTYAGYWVRARMLAFILRSWSIVGFGTSPLRTRLFFGLQRERARLAPGCADEHELVQALARRFDCSPERIVEASARLGGGDVCFEEDRGELPEVAGNPEVVVLALRRAEAVRAAVGRVRDSLGERDATVLDARLYTEEAPASLASLGREFGVSRERVGQLERRVKARLCAELLAWAPDGFSMAA